MSAYKDQKTGKWYVFFYYRNWQGENKGKTKRGFATKREALEWERNFKLKQSENLDMTMNEFYKLYEEDMKPKLKLNTWLTKKHIIKGKVLPYFGERKMNEITSTDILQWQNELLGVRDDDGKGYSQTYLRTIQNQLNAIMNHTVKYYDLPKNPCIANKKMGKAKAKEMLFWTREEYQKFSEKMKIKPVSYYAFQILYWTGIRCGELLALTRADFDFNNQMLRINKTFQVIKGEEIVTSPKTEKSNRRIDLPEFICDEMQDYLASLYKVDDDSRIFEVTKSYLHHEMDRGSKAAGVKRIRIHDLRHSSCALLINLGYSPVQIAERLGHESVTITERYSHLYPSVQKDMAKKLDSVFKEDEDDD